MVADADDPREAEWISRALVHDDHAAFACLVRQHERAVRHFLRRLCAGDHARADDLAQDCFLKAWRHLRSYQGRGRFVSWLLRIAWQGFVDDRRRHGANLDELSIDTDELASDEGGPEQAADAAVLQRRLAALRPAESGALLLHYHYGQSHAEIAETLELPLGTIKSLILRARAKLRSGLQRDNEEKP